MDGWNEWWCVYDLWLLMLMLLMQLRRVEAIYVIPT